MKRRQFLRCGSPVASALFLPTPLLSTPLVPTLLVPTLLVPTLLLPTMARPASRPVVIGVTLGPHAEIIEVVRRVAATRGLDLRADLRPDGRGINADVAAGLLDVACFQDAVAFAAETRRRHDSLVSVASTVTRPIAIYSRRLVSPRALEDGASIGIPQDPVMAARALILLQNYGLLTLRDAAGLAARQRDIVDNRRSLRFVPLPSDQLPKALDRLACAVIDSDSAARAGLQPARDSIGIEDARTPYTDILAVRRADRAAPWVATLVESYHSDTVKRFILERFQDSLRRPLVNHTTVSFHCTACGDCCNTPPTMTVPELFHHEDRFVGCLAIRRLPRHRAFARLPCGEGGEHRLSVVEAEEADALAGRLSFTAGDRFGIGTQAIDYASLGACSERLSDGRCGIHDDHKPATCGTVPLDPLVPDRLQHVVLMQRRHATGYRGADCIAAGRRDGHAVLVADGEIADPGYRDATARQRDALAVEKSLWGSEVFGLLRRDLFDDAAQARRVPSDGCMSLPLVPVLMVLAERSPGSRERCLRYVRRQMALIEVKIVHAVRRRLDADKPLTRELRSFLQAYRRFEDAVARRPPGERRDRATDGYLGLAAGPGDGRTCAT